jgi:hypothetical protein
MLLNGPPFVTVPFISCLGLSTMIALLAPHFGFRAGNLAVGEIRCGASPLWGHYTNCT